MSNIMFLILILTLVEAFSVDGQSTLGSCEASDRNLADEMRSAILTEIRSIVKEELLGLRLSNLVQTLQSFSNRLEVLGENVQIGRELSEDLHMQFKNISKLYKEQNRYIQSTDKKVEEDNKYTVYQNTTYSPTQDCRGGVRAPRDCADIRKGGQNVSGVYQIFALGPCLVPIEVSVFCEMNLSSNVGWLMFQRRQDGSENFERTWIEYKNGFGNLTGEFWLGNDALHLLTSTRNYKLRIELEDFEGAKRYAEYATFSVGSASDNYTLNISGYSGNAGDSLEYQNGQMFSTLDADNDQSSSHCAQERHGAWWYNSCASSNLNGLYLRGTHTSLADGICWSAFRGYKYSLKKVVMKIAP